MTVWYLENQDCGGVFSTREKAMESFCKCAERCGWRNVRVTNDWSDQLTYAYEWQNADGVWMSDEDAYITAYELDKHNG